MDIMNTALYLVVNAFHILVLALTFHIFFGQSKLPQYAEGLCYVLFFAANSIAFLVAENPFLNLATSVLPLFAIVFIYHGKLRNRLLVGVFVCAASMLLESGSLSIILLFNLEAVIKSQIIGNLAANLVLFVAVHVYRKARQSKITGNVSLLHWLPIVTLPIGSMVIIVLVYAAEYGELTNVVIVALLLCMNVLVFQLYSLLDNYYFMKYEHSLLLSQTKAYAHEFELIQKNDENMRIARHDLRNHVATMHQLLDRSELGGLKQYLASMSEQLIPERGAVSTGNTEVDSILNYKLAAIEAIGTKMEIEVRIPMQLTLPVYDLSAILGNLLDNAADALDDCPDKYLKLLIYFDRGVLYIQISNSYAGEIKKATAGGRTTYLSRKRHSDMSGIGLSSVKQTIARYDGDMEIEDRDHYFVVSIMLYLPS